MIYQNPNGKKKIGFIKNIILTPCDENMQASICKSPSMGLVLEYGVLHIQLSLLRVAVGKWC